MSLYKCSVCGFQSSFYAFRGASSDGSYLKCSNCGNTRTIYKLVPTWDEDDEL